MNTSRQFQIVAICFTILCWFPAGAQKNPPGGPPKGNPGMGSVVPNTGPSTNTFDRPVLYVRGKVVFNNGGPPPEPVAIERVCGGSVRKEAYTDSRGEFGFQVGQSTQLQDASQGGSDMVAGRSSSGVNNPSSGGFNPVTRQYQYLDCELRASLAGYVSTSVMLRPDGNTEQLAVGPIFLRPMGNVHGATVSLTTLTAPKNARRAYEKAQGLVAHKKLEPAEKELTTAIEIYPQFAAAWSLLGEVHEGQGHIDEAKKAYGQAAASDPQFVRPLFGLAVIGAKQQEWREVVLFTNQIEKLNPFAYPMAYLLNAAGNYYLGHQDEAERSARKFASMDSSHTRPDVALLLGDILEAKRDYAGAAQQMRDYLAAYPNAPNAAHIRDNLKRLEAMQTAKAQ
ncbi:MAG TPA: tetratricopeptide repeat protein [Verrucomicrobiae bacterium]|jgi:tetratricopeptide (TPR) repeat protein|nr:tetratricopeptide repeat protein [Verrucomicrobiae bacterium]